MLLDFCVTQGARRIVAEWPGLDKEARDFTARIQKDLSINMDSQLSSSIPIDDLHLGDIKEEMTVIDKMVVDRESEAELW